MYFFGNPILGMGSFLLLAILINGVSYFICDKVVLRAYKARIVSEAEEPRLHRIVDSVVSKSGLPKPKVAIIPTDNPNAFATGRNPENAVVAVTEGIKRILNDDELEGVIAHEIAHIKDRDILLMSIAATIAGAIAFAAHAVWYSMYFGRRDANPILLLIVAITAPIAAMLVQLAISRGREYKADRVGAETIGKPLALANALKKLEKGNRNKPIDIGSPASSSLFIVNPFRGGFASIFSTHPPIEERIRRLEEM
ncbi:MAG: zinc metalloprotease HtpX [Candidatus Thermoplasmatota archaeon]